MISVPLAFAFDFSRDLPQEETEALETTPSADEEAPEEVEGVFLVREGVAHFVPVEVGITGQEYFEVLSGVQPGDTVVAGPYQRIRELSDGDLVKAMAGSRVGVTGTRESEG